MAPPRKTDNSDTAKEPAKKRGWDEIESLFQSKKEHKQQAAAVADEAKKKKQLHCKQRQRQREEAADEFACRVDKEAWNQWVDDGLGGKFNGEGFTGRVEDGVRIFKGHVLDKPDAGQTDKCPFDCDCCYI